MGMQTLQRASQAEGVRKKKRRRRAYNDFVYGRVSSNSGWCRWRLEL